MGSSDKVKDESKPSLHQAFTMPIEEVDDDDQTSLMHTEIDSNFTYEAGDFHNSSPTKPIIEPVTELKNVIPETNEEHGSSSSSFYQEGQTPLLNLNLIGIKKMEASSDDCDECSEDDKSMKDEEIDDSQASSFFKNKKGSS